MGYTPETVRGLLKVLGQLGRWMAERGLEPADLCQARVDEFLAFRRIDHYQQSPCRRSLRLLLELMAAEGVVLLDDPQPGNPVEGLIGAYCDWLANDRGLAETTVIRYGNSARRFLRHQLGDREQVDLQDLNGADVSSFLLAECDSGRFCVGAVKGRVAELRSLLRFLFLRGLTERSLAASVPPVAGWTHTGIPRTADGPTIDLLLQTFDRSTESGVRNFAMVMLVARLGLRSIEVARLQLDDVDWRNGELAVRGKARRTDRLPLPAEAGQALVSYLTDARPPVQSRQLFITCRAPRQPIRAEVVGDVVERACLKAGIPVIGPHRIRHAVATELLACGVPIIDISQVLRHRDLATTAIYAKVDLRSLRQVAREWPGAQQ
jgi:site-specific recombinase XerD